MKNKTAFLLGALSGTLAAGVAGIGFLLSKKEKRDTISVLYLVDSNSLNLVNAEKETYIITIDGFNLLVNSEIASKMEINEKYTIVYKLNDAEGYDGEVISSELIF